MAMRIYHRRPRRYHWPELQLNIWILVVLSSSAICLGIFAWFMTVQNDLGLEVPWYANPQFHPPSTLQPTILTPEDGIALSPSGDNHSRGVYSLRAVVDGPGGDIAPAVWGCRERE
ncbi:hypothetical protein An02g07240 [Aspergillus niger]|uniref:Uncharacterized protein n=2 Tax=Aspergillus niger TaxID=5061 RepID=A2QDI7_ASPNC|nr:hypothetical protein An02g07240 [Aspergillus niger]CAK37688.1 hypothetical protein An02g07240 [Aspergillus niger]